MPSEPSGEERQRNNRIVKEILDLTGHSNDNIPTVKEDVILGELKAINKDVSDAVLKYYETHALTTNVPELRKIIMNIYMESFGKYSRDDLHFLLTVQQTKLAMTKFGYER
jgi:uncharacterized protein YdaL